MLDREEIENDLDILDELEEELSNIEGQLEEACSIKSYQVWGDMLAEKSSDAFPIIDLCNNCVSNYEVVFENSSSIGNICKCCGCEDNINELENRKNEIEEEIEQIKNELLEPIEEAEDYLNKLKDRLS